MALKLVPKGLSYFNDDVINQLFEVVNNTMLHIIVNANRIMDTTLPPSPHHAFLFHPAYMYDCPFFSANVGRGKNLRHILPTIAFNTSLTK
jgi:hypothetical protein